MSGKLEAVLIHIFKSLKMDVTDYCDIETIDGNQCLVMNDGSLATLVEFKGKTSVLGRNEFEKFISALTITLSAFFARKGHAIQFVFIKDFINQSALDSVIKSQKKTAEILRLDINDIIDEVSDVYSNYVYSERCYIVLWSYPALLDDLELKLSKAEKNEFRKNNDWPSLKTAQNLLRPISALHDHHTSYVNTVTNTFRNRNNGFSISILDVSDALNRIRRTVYPDITQDEWKPYIPVESSSIPLRWKDNNDVDDKSEFMYPDISEQIMTASFSAPKRNSNKANANDPMNDPTLLKVGDRLFAPLMFKFPPAETHGLTFNKLFNELNATDTRQNGERKALPYSFSMMIESDGMNVFRFKQIFAGFLGMASDINKNINAARKKLKERLRNGERIVKMRMSAMTWADSENYAELLLRKRKLWKAMESWGNATVIENTGNPMFAFQSNALALSHKHIANPAPAPLYEALMLTPITRPSSVFANTTTVTRSLCGKLMPWERFSDIQSVWLNLFCGRPGAGKSVTVNSMNIDACLMPGMHRIPYLCYLDIGISSEGFITAIKDALPPELQYLAIYKRLQNTAEDCINPFDLHLGGREPLPYFKTFIVNFITLLVTPTERKGIPYTGMSSLVSELVNAVYKLRDTGDKGQPNKYNAGEYPLIDKKIEELGITASSGHTNYYDLVDRLFEAGCIYEAEIAQRSAVPVLSDLAAVCQREDIKATFDIQTEGNNLIKLFTFGLKTATERYPMFNSSTKFDLGSARVVALDLQDVALKTRDPALMQQNALMYMMASQAFFKKISFSKEIIQSIRPQYKQYYMRLCNELIDEVKIIDIDEYHNTGGNESFQNALDAYARESRKWKLEINILSQIPEDFKDLIKLASTVVLLESGSEDTRKYIKENMSLPDVAEHALVTHCHGPSKDGSTFLAIINGKDNVHYQLYTLTLGAKRLWRLSTTAEDRKLRSNLYERMPKKEAINILAKRFPSGGCKSYVDKLKHSLASSSKNDFDEDEINAEIVEKIANDLYQEYMESL